MFAVLVATQMLLRAVSRAKALRGQAFCQVVVAAAVAMTMSPVVVAIVISKAEVECDDWRVEIVVILRDKHPALRIDKL
jgi:hypothetical protein